MKFFIAITFSLAGAALALPQQKGAACSAAQQSQVASLAKGIQDNINIQGQELQGVKDLQALDKAGAGGKASAQFEAQRQKVLGIQNSGVSARANNQKIAAGLNSPSVAGLAIVANAQTTEINQVKGLSGTGSAADAATFTKLIQEVQDGTNQNKKNLAAAQSQCAGK